MEGGVSQTIQLIPGLVVVPGTGGNEGEQFYQLNDGAYYAHVETGLVYADSDPTAQHPLGQHDGSE